MNRSTGIVGAGWAGLALADRLADAGGGVTLIEAAPVLGGRAREAEVRLAGRRLALDNGQHLMIGAYRETLSLLGRLHGSTPPVRRLPLQFESQRFGLSNAGTGRLGLLAGLARARGCPASDRLRLVALGVKLAARRWRGFSGQTVRQLLERTGQSEWLIARFWRPFCLAALNTPPETACAQTFVNVLHDSLMIDTRGSDFLVPTMNLGALLAGPLARSLRERGVELLHPWPVRTVQAAPGGRWRVLAHGDAREAREFDRLVLACGPAAAARLLEGPAPDAARALGRFEYQAITTVYLGWEASDAVRLPELRMLEDGPGAPGQWLFDRGDHQGLRVASVVISASGDTCRDLLVAGLQAQLAAQLDLPAAADTAVVREKRATFSCVPDRPLAGPARAGSHDLPAGLWLTGDYCTPRYPATLEGALHSSRETAAAMAAAA